MLQTIATEKVDSSTIAEVGYNATSKILKVKFKNGSSYLYIGVSKDLYQQLQKATSIGSTFHQRVKTDKRLIAVKEDDLDMTKVFQVIKAMKEDDSNCKNLRAMLIEHSGVI